MITTLLLALFLSGSGHVNEPRPLDAQDLLRAMRQALGNPEVQIEIVEVSHYPAPAGEIEFARKDLAQPAGSHAPARWRGYILWGDGRRFSIWADVKLAAPCRRVMVAQTLPQEVPIQAAQLREENYQGFPSEACSWRAQEAVGMVPLHTVAAGAPLSRETLALPAAVLKGQEATAEYRAGGVHLSLTVIAERNGRIGEIIPVLNPSSHKIFQARVAGTGTVAVEGPGTRP